MIGIDCWMIRIWGFVTLFYFCQCLNILKWYIYVFEQQNCREKGKQKEKREKARNQGLYSNFPRGRQDPSSAALTGVLSEIEMCNVQLGIQSMSTWDRLLQAVAEHTMPPLTLHFTAKSQISIVLDMFASPPLSHLISVRASNLS